jgi:ribosomal protein S19E (S16A)
MKAINCYGRVNNGNWAQETYESASRDAGRRVKQLRAAGYVAVSGSLGAQVTSVGVVKLTQVDIRPGSHADTFGLPEDNWTLTRI